MKNADILSAEKRPFFCKEKADIQNNISCIGIITFTYLRVQLSINSS